MTDSFTKKEPLFTLCIEGLVAKGPRDRALSRAETPRVQGLFLTLAGADEHPPVVGTPDVAGKAVITAEPQAIAIARHAEHEEVADRIANRLHADKNPPVHRLVIVLQPQLRTDFRRTELQAELFGTLVDLVAPGTVLESELSDSDLDQINFRLSGGNRELGLTDDVVCPVADLHSAVFDGLAEIVSGLESGRAELDGFPCRQINVDGLDHQLARQKTTNTVVAAQLVENRLNLSESPIIVLHDTLPLSSL